MQFVRPTPIWNGKAWVVDLRKPWNCGRHIIKAPPPPLGLVEAVHASRDLLDELRSRSCSPQLALPGTDGRTIGQAFDAYLKARKYRKPGGRRWVELTAAVICREIGAEPLSVLAPPSGAAWLADWTRRTRTDERKRKVGPRAMRDRLNVLSMFVHWCAHPDRLWLPAVVEFPDGRLDETERMHNPRSEWVEEDTFRRVLEALYCTPLSRANLRREHGADAIEDIICRRKLYLSVGYCVGMRRADLNAVLGRHISPDCQWIVRFASKCSTKPEWERVCPPLTRDLLAEKARLGRHWAPDEAPCGGVWMRAPRIIREVCKRLEIPGFDLRTLRRSFVRMKALAGVKEEDLVRLMGHADSRMIHEVYLRVPPVGLTDAAGEAWPESAPAAPLVAPIRRLRLVPSETGAETALNAPKRARR